MVFAAALVAVVDQVDQLGVAAAAAVSGAVLEAEVVAWVDMGVVCVVMEAVVLEAGDMGRRANTCPCHWDRALSTLASSIESYMLAPADSTSQQLSYLVPIVSS